MRGLHIYTHPGQYIPDGARGSEPTSTIASNTHCLAPRMSARPEEAKPGGAPDPTVSETDPESALRGTLPLILLTAALFVGSYAVYALYPDRGPYNFPLWGLLLTLAFVAAIGAVVSWFFAVDDTEAVAKEARATTTPTPSSTEGSRSDFGRPVPEVSARRPSATAPAGNARPATPARPSVAPWDEDAIPPLATRGPRPVLTTPDDPGDIARALEEIEEIQRQLAIRPTGTASSAEASARA
jgi:hypothetical protein